MKIKSPIKKKVLIYGAGEAGRQLANSLKTNPKFQVVGFIDDNKKLNKKILLKKEIYSLTELKKLIAKKNVSLIFLAMPVTPSPKAMNSNGIMAKYGSPNNSHMRYTEAPAIKQKLTSFLLSLV